MASHPTIVDIRAAADRIAGTVVPTRAILSDVLSQEAGVPIWLKLENEQETGSFKVRGAANTMLQLSSTEVDAGVVAVSSGNHGRAVAHVARMIGAEATICISSRVPEVKVEAMQRLGATVVVAGPDQDDADAKARDLVAQEGLTFIHPFDDPRVIAGQGTIGIEVLQQVAEVATVVVPLSGGGLAGGIAVAVNEADPSVEVIGISQQRGPAMVRSIAAGHLVDVVEEDTLADALAGSLGPENHHSFDLCARLLKRTALVSEDQIAAAMATLWRAESVKAEGGGAVGVAAVQAGLALEGPTVIVVSGGNISETALQQVAKR